MRQLGYIPDSTEQRAADIITHKVFGVTAPGDPSETNWKEVAPIPIRDQGTSNFCVRFAMTRALEHLEWVTTGEDRGHFSPLFLAWFDAMPGWQGRNEGTQIYRSAEALRMYGVCGEAAYSWERDRPGDYLRRMGVAPHARPRAEALRHQSMKDYRISDGDVDAVFAAIERGHAVVFGCPVGSTFKTDADGVLLNSGALRGYHAMTARDIKMVRGEPMADTDNSWGRGWGEKGTCLIPPSEIRKWQDIRVVTGLEGI